MDDSRATQEEINEWYGLQKRMSEDKLREMWLRKKIFATFFTEPKEGVNQVPMTDGFVMKGTYKIDRKILVDQLDLWLPKFKDAKLPLKDLVEQKPSLKISEYKKLDGEQQKLFDNALEIKPASPSLEITKPKKA